MTETSNLLSIFGDAPPASSMEMLLCAPKAVEPLLSSWQRFLADPTAFEKLEPQVFDRMRGRETSVKWGGYKVDNGSALIPLMGMLIPTGTFVGSIWGMTSQEGLRSEISRAAADPEVSQIVLMIDSPGGFAAGTDATASLIRNIKTKKPVIAHVTGMAASGAYWIASQATQILSTPTSEIGSIGVLMAHTDLSAVYKAIGVKITLIHAGAKKIDGNPYEELSERVKADLQNRVDDLRMAFAEEVVTGRDGKISLNAVLRTEGATYLPTEAIAMGLIDGVEQLDTVIGSVDSGNNDEGSDLDDLLNLEDDDEVHAMHEPLIANQEPEIVQEQVPVVQVSEEDVHNAKIEGRAIEQKRIQGIITHAAAKGRENLANHFAFNTSLPIELVIPALESSPIGGQSVKTTPSLKEEMRQYKKPILGVDAGPKPEGMSLGELGAMNAKMLLGKK